MATAEFYFKGHNIAIQCNKYDRIKQLFQSFYMKTGTKPNSVTFLYNGGDITNEESTFEQLANIDDKYRNKMNILVANTLNNSSSQFIFEKVKGADESMKDFAKMVILLGMKEYPDNDGDKCNLILDKFEEHYEGHWSCSIIKNEYGESAFYQVGYFMRIKYGNYIIKIAKTSE